MKAAQVSNHAMSRYKERYPIWTAGMSWKEVRNELRARALSNDPTIVMEDGVIVTVLAPGMRPMKESEAKKRRAARIPPLSPAAQSFMRTEHE